MRWRTRILAGQAPRLTALILEQLDRTLRELREALATKASMATIWRVIDRVDITVEEAVQAFESEGALQDSQPSCALPGPAPLMSTEAAG